MSSSRAIGPLTIMRTAAPPSRCRARGSSTRGSPMPSTAATTTGMYSGRQPAITALMATFSAVTDTARWVMKAISWSGSSSAASSIADAVLGGRDDREPVRPAPREASSTASASSARRKTLRRQGSRHGPAPGIAGHASTARGATQPRVRLDPHGTRVLSLAHLPFTQPGGEYQDAVLPVPSRELRRRQVLRRMWDPARAGLSGLRDPQPTGQQVLPAVRRDHGRGRRPLRLARHLYAQSPRPQDPHRPDLAGR